jgi:hypothetical protein
VREALVRRCRFAEVPVDDVERLAIWCRKYTPPEARFVGPPGQKTFRLWSLRNLAFNRAGSPYSAAGLSDWFARYQDHVGVRDSPQAFVSAYLRDRHGLERRYDDLTPSQKSQLATRQGAAYVLAAAPKEGSRLDAERDGLALLHVEGRLAVYRVSGRAQIAKSDSPGRR